MAGVVWDLNLEVNAPKSLYKFSFPSIPPYKLPQNGSALKLQQFALGHKKWAFDAFCHQTPIM